MSSSPSPPSHDLFQEPPVRREFPTAAVAIAVVAVVILAALLIFMGRGQEGGAAPNTVQPAAAYASALRITDVTLSESTSLSGGKSTYIDGRITNSGSQTVTGATLQALFANDQALPPQVQTVPLTLIRTREPYVDTEPVSAAPLAPGGSAEFRLIFEDVNSNWNEQPPELRIIRVSTK